MHICYRRTKGRTHVFEESRHFFRENSAGRCLCRGPRTYANNYPGQVEQEKPAINLIQTVMELLLVSCHRLCLPHSHADSWKSHGTHHCKWLIDVRAHALDTRPNAHETNAAMRIELLAIRRRSLDPFGPRASSCAHLGSSCSAARRPRTSLLLDSQLTTWLGRKDVLKLFPSSSRRSQDQAIRALLRPCSILVVLFVVPRLERGLRRCVGL